MVVRSSAAYNRLHILKAGARSRKALDDTKETERQANANANANEQSEQSLRSTREGRNLC
jgi:multidrug resistance efflux pump